MATERISPSRRRLLATGTSLLAAAGVAAGAVPFVRAWQPGARAQAGMAPLPVDISPLQPGQQRVVAWRGKPVFILRRSATMLQSLAQGRHLLADPRSEASVQPPWVDVEYRSIRPDLLVVIGLCTHLGCVPLLQVAEGSYFCPCHASRYDLAGRVYRHQPAPLNLEVPPYHYAADGLIVLGSGPEAA